MVKPCPFLTIPAACRERRHQEIRREKIGHLSMCTNCKPGIAHMNAEIHREYDDKKRHHVPHRKTIGGGK